MSDVDLSITWDEEDVGVSRIEIVALTEQARIDLQTELPRIKKLLERDWLNEHDD